MSNEKIIELSGIVKSYGRHKVLDGLNMTVYRNNVYALLGNNGEGKSTAMRMPAGQMSPDAGSVRVFGRDPVRHALEVKPRVSYIAELMKVYDELTLDQLREFLKPFFPKWNSRQYAELVKTFGLPPECKLKSFSRGMYAKAVLVLALCREPELLLLDDPCLGLDTTSRRNFMEMLVDTLSQSDCTILLSTHLIPEAAGIIDRIGILKDGKLTVEADVPELLDRTRLLRLPAESEMRLPKLDVLKRKLSGPELMLTVRGGEAELGAMLAAIPELAFRLTPLSLEETVLAYTN